MATLMYRAMLMTRFRPGIFGGTRSEPELKTGGSIRASSLRVPRVLAMSVTR
jgi:hypothetical protein